MRTRIIDNLKRFFSICLVLALMFSAIGFKGIVVYAVENDFEKVTFALNSNVVDDERIELYLQDSVYFISFDNLCLLTRSTKSVDGNVISVTHGFWRAEFDVASQMFNDRYQMVDIPILKISNDEYAVPALMFLSYYKAMAFIDNDIFFCEMPECTAWEALNVDYANTLVDIYELYGGETNVIKSLTIDILMDLLMGNDMSTEIFLKSAYYEALEVDIYSYDVVEQYVNERNEKVYNNLLAEETQRLLESISALCETGDTSNKITQEAMDLYILFHYTGQIKDFYNLAFNAIEIGDTTSMRQYADQIVSVWREGEFQKSLVENNTKSVEGIFFLLSSAVEAAQQVKYVHQENNLIYRVMGQENMKKLSLDVGDNEWYEVANIYKSTATSLQDSFVDVLKELQTDIVKDLVSEASKVLAKALLDTDDLMMKLTGAQTASWKIGLEAGRVAANVCSWIDSLAKPDSFVDNLLTDIDAYTADRLALYLSELQQNVYWVLCHEYARLYNNKGDINAYEDYIYAQQLYCRTSIAMYENLITMVDEFGKNRAYWTSLFQDRIDKLAISLYQLTTLQDDGINQCLPLELRTFSIPIADDDSSTANIDANDINAINALLIGVGYAPDQAESAVTSWSDEQIFDIICRKRLWDWDATYLTKLGIGDEFSIDLSLVEELTQDMFGRSFPVNAQSGLGSVAGNKLNIELIMGESTELVVQKGSKQGNRVTVVGSVYHHYVPYSEFCGYFSAELVKNPSSIYGYTLISIYRTEGNQNFDKLIASASSELKESSLTHDANRAIDGDSDTAWVEGVHGVGINEWIRLETSDNSKMTVSAIEFSLGYQKSDQLLKNNGWPNKVLIECESGYTQEAEFYICDYSSVVVLDRPQTTSWIKITILDAYSGAKYDDTCISEICLYGIDPNKETIADNPNDGESLSTEHDYMSDEEQSEIDLYLAFCESLSSTYTSSDGSTAGMKSCVVVDFKEDVPNLVVHYINPNAYGSPGTFYEVWMIYGIVSGQVVELFKEENSAPTRRSINLVYDEEYRYALREEQAFSGYYDVIIHYPTNVSDTAMYENYNYIQLPEESHILRVWTISGDYVDISF